MHHQSIARPASLTQKVPRRRPWQDRAGLGIVLAGIGAGLAVALAVGESARRQRTAVDPRRRDPLRRIGDGAAILGASVLADSAIEHFQGGFRNPAMLLAPASAAATIAASMAEPGSIRPRRRLPARAAGPRGLAHAAGLAVGAAGLGFHAYNITKRPGGISWNNLFYAAPLGAPGALAVAGLMGLGSEALAAAGRQGLRAETGGRALAALSSASLLATAAEAGLLHFRGAFHNPAMVLPVSVPPAAGLALAGEALRPSSGGARTARALLWTTAALGLVGTGFHAFGVARNMGGWANWRQNLLAGPPMPAPVSFTGIALGGLAALDLMTSSGKLG